MSDYQGATLIGEETEMLLDPGASELLIGALDELIDLLEEDLADEDEDVSEADSIAVRLDEIIGLRDALHSVVGRYHDESPGDPL